MNQWCPGVDYWLYQCHFNYIIIIITISVPALSELFTQTGGDSSFQNKGQSRLKLKSNFCQINLEIKPVSSYRPQHVCLQLNWAPSETADWSSSPSLSVALAPAPQHAHSLSLASLYIHWSPCPLSIKTSGGLWSVIYPKTLHQSQCSFDCTLTPSVGREASGQRSASGFEKILLWPLDIGLMLISVPLPWL